MKSPLSKKNLFRIIFFFLSIGLYLAFLLLPTNSIIYFCLVITGGITQFNCFDWYLSIKKPMLGLSIVAYIWMIGFFSLLTGHSLIVNENTQIIIGSITGITVIICNTFLNWEHILKKEKEIDFYLDTILIIAAIISLFLVLYNQDFFKTLSHIAIPFGVQIAVLKYSIVFAKFLASKKSDSK